ncbi:MAG TPA: type 4a pilus biogenesis protein PilO [Methylomirabilota bacterium]|jgi:type IV pilus assembly protein PilO|nr:type 4a pilus biogenesis protein PilO [Methylomirabilota bacterium]
MDSAELKKLVLIGLLILAVAYVGYNGFSAIGYAGVAGWRADAAKLLVERQKLDANVKSATAMVANLDKIKREREALEAQLKELSRRLPGERESAEVLRSVESLAGKSGLTIGQVKRRPLRTQELYVEIPMEVSVGGGYHDLVKFADQLAHLERIVTLNEIQVQRPGPTTGSQAPAVNSAPGSVKAQMVAVVFQALPEPSPATPGAPAPGAPAPPR